MKGRSDTGSGQLLCAGRSESESLRSYQSEPRCVWGGGCSQFGEVTWAAGTARWRELGGIPLVVLVRRALDGCESRIAQVQDSKAVGMCLCAPGGHCGDPRGDTPLSKGQAAWPTPSLPSLPGTAWFLEQGGQRRGGALWVQRSKAREDGPPASLGESCYGVEASESRTITPSPLWMRRG